MDYLPLHHHYLTINIGHGIWTMDYLPLLPHYKLALYACFNISVGSRLKIRTYGMSCVIINTSCNVKDGLSAMTSSLPHCKLCVRCIIYTVDLVLALQCVL